MCSAIRSLLLFLFCLTPAFADTVVLAGSGDDASPAILSIISGIRQVSTIQSIEYIDSLDDYDNKHSADVDLIVLGSDLIAQTSDFEHKNISIGGGFYSPVSSAPPIRVLSLLPDIEVIANEIKKTGFDLRTITTITISDSLKTNLEQYSESLANIGIKHIVNIAKNERDVAKQWFHVLKNIDPMSNAIYIADGTYIESSGAYKEIIEQAWRNNIMVVSALPQFSRRGVSIGLIPDLPAYGRALVEASDSLRDNSAVPPTITNSTLSELIRVYNQRTLRHIGYSLPADIDRLPRNDIVVK